MDDTLKELKKLREEIEERFRELLDGIDDEQARLREELLLTAETIEALVKAPRDIPPGAAKAWQKSQALQERLLGLCARLAEGLREMMALDNARSAELARQVTALPLERMDLLVGELERRLEQLESRIQRLEP